MKILCNGQPREVAANTTISELLKILELEPRQVAVEVNLQLIPRDQHSQHLLQADDRLEVVTLVGGG